MITPFVLNVLKNTVHRNKNSDSKVILHSDQGSQYSSYGHKVFAKVNNIILSISRRGNCYDSAAAESFFKNPEKRACSKAGILNKRRCCFKIFEYIEMFYNSKRRHSYLGYISLN